MRYNKSKEIENSYCSMKANKNSFTNAQSVNNSLVNMPNSVEIKVIIYFCVRGRLVSRNG